MVPFDMYSTAGYLNAVASVVALYLLINIYRQPAAPAP